MWNILQFRTRLQRVFCCADKMYTRHTRCAARVRLHDSSNSSSNGNSTWTTECVSVSVAAAAEFSQHLTFTRPQLAVQSSCCSLHWRNRIQYYSLTIVDSSIECNCTTHTHTRSQMQCRAHSTHPTPSSETFYSAQCSAVSDATLHYSLLACARARALSCSIVPLSVRVLLLGSIFGSAHGRPT